MFWRSLRHLLARGFQFGQQDVADNPGEQVVEIMSNAAGQQPHGLKFLGAPQLLFHAQLFGDVPEKAPQCHGFSINKAAVDLAFDGNFPAVLAQENGLAGNFLAVLQDILEIFPAGLAVVGVQDIKDIELAQVVVVIAQGFLPGLIHHQNPAVRGNASSMSVAFSKRSRYRSSLSRRAISVRRRLVMSMYRMTMRRSSPSLLTMGVAIIS